MAAVSRFLILSLLVLAAVARAGEPHDAVRDALCDAAVQESALPAQMDSLIESDVLRHDQAGALLSMPCPSGASLLEQMVNKRQAENLEYMTVDMGLDPEAAVLDVDGEALSLSAYLERRSRDGNPEVAEFAASYRELLTDESFNPSLMVHRN